MAANLRNVNMKSLVISTAGSPPPPDIPTVNLTVTANPPNNVNPYPPGSLSTFWTTNTDPDASPEQYVFCKMDVTTATNKVFYITMVNWGQTPGAEAPGAVYQMFSTEISGTVNSVELQGDWGGYSVDLVAANVYPNDGGEGEYIPNVISTYDPAGISAKFDMQAGSTVSVYWIMRSTVFDLPEFGSYSSYYDEILDFTNSVQILDSDGVTVLGTVNMVAA